MFFQALNDSRLCDKSNVNVSSKDISTKLQILSRVLLCCYYVRCNARKGGYIDRINNLNDTIAV